MLLQNVRDKAQGWVAKVIVVAIACTFAIFGLESLRPNTGNPDVAVIDGEPITQQQLLEAIDQQRRALIQRMGDDFDPSLLESSAMQSMALESLIHRTLLRARLKSESMVVSEDMLDEVIRNAPVFQVNGQYRPERVLQYVRGLGLSVTKFRNMIRDEMLATQLHAGIAASEFVTATELRQLNSLQNQTRDIRWLTLDAKAARKAVRVSDDDIAAYYDAHSAQFMQPEQVSVDYVVLDKGKLAESIEVTEQDMRTRYNARVAELKSQASSERHASMILLKPSEARDRIATIALADKLSQQLKEGGDFAKLAREYSDDPDTATEGGALGAVKTGSFGEAFASALEALQPGHVSAPVITESGVVLIRREADVETPIPSFAQMRASIEGELRDQAVEPLFIEQSQKLADISFEASDLAQPAEVLGLDIQQSSLFSRSGGDGVAANPRVVEAAFSNDVLELGANTDLVELSDGQVAVFHIRQRVKSQQKPRAEVKDEIVSALRVERAGGQLQAQARELIAALSGGADPQELAKNRGLVWIDRPGIQRFDREAPAQLLAEAFRVAHPDDGGASFGTAVQPGGDVAVIQVTKVTSGSDNLDTEQAGLMGASLAMRSGSQLYDEYVRNLREMADVKVLRARSEG